MTEPYVGEIRYFPYLRVPQGWQRCDGSTLSIAGNEMLFTVIGTTYGGDGINTFAVPNLQGRIAIGSGRSNTGTTYSLGQMGGQETVTLSTPQMPVHSHFIEASTDNATATAPTSAVFATAATDNGLYNSPATPSPVPMANGSAAAAGSGMPHDNCAPTIAIWAFIALVGIFPSQN